MPLTYSAPAVDLTLKIIASCGIDPHPLMRKFCIDPQKIADPNARFRYKQIDALWSEAEALIDDPCFGLKSAIYWHPSHMGALGYAWLSSSSLRAGLQRFAKYMRILTEGATLGLEETNDTLSAVLHYKPESMQHPTRTDSAMALLVAMCRANYGDEFTPVSISLTHPAPDCSGKFFELFRCPINFDAADNRFTLTLESADKQLQGSNPLLSTLHDQFMIDYLARLDDTSLQERVRAEIIQQLPDGNINDSSVAEALYMNVRTLQRRLQKEQTTFKSQVTSVRQELANHYIRDSSKGLAEISYLLGFSEMSSFSRAFKRWTGETPSHYREQ
ncbi:MAG: AraC family transcriptional regulator [Pseudomonadota bacterium]|nr:AraC family transcriptional regulator [Pseudomonadota bacterium]